MKRLSIANIGKGGINSDAMPWDLPPEFLTYGLNFKSYINYVKGSSGYEDWDQLPFDIHPGFIMFSGDFESLFWVIAGRDAIYSFNGANWYDITPAGFSPLASSAELLWNGCLLGSVPILNNYQDYPMYWSPASGANPLTYLPFSAGVTWADQFLKAKVIRSHKNYLFALYLQEGATEYKNAYRWSHPADINGIPFSWDETDTSSLAGRAQTGGDYGDLIDGKTLRDHFVMYSTNGINILSESGDEFVWNRTGLSSTIGLLSSNCIVEVKGDHFFIGTGDIVRNNGNNIESIIHGKMQKYFNSRMNASYYNRSFAVPNHIEKEIWFCIPVDDSEYPNLAFIYNWKEDSWSLRDLPENTVFAGYGGRDQQLQTWDTWSGTWDDQSDPWGNNKVSSANQSIVGVDIDGSVSIIDSSINTNPIPVTTTIERTNLPIDGIDNATTITEVYPHISGSSPVTIQFGSHKYAGSPVQWKDPIVFNPGIDKKLNIRSTGLLHAWRITSETPSNWALSGLDLTYQIAGKR